MKNRVYVVSKELVRKYGMSGIIEDAYLSGRTVLIESELYEQFINMMNLKNMKMKVKIA